MAPQLSVVIASLGRVSPAEVIASIGRSAASIAAAVEVVVVWQAAFPPHGLPGDYELVLRPPLGVSYARNEGFRRSGGELVAFLDDDETVEESYVPALLRAFEAGPAGVVGPVLPRGDALPHSHYHGSVPRRFRGMRTPPWRIGTGGNMAFERRAFEAVRGFDVRLGAGSAGLAGEDFDIIVRLQRAGLVLHWEPAAIVYHPTKSVAESLVSRYPYGYGIGRMAAQLRSPSLALRYSVALGQATRDAVRDRSPLRLRLTSANARGFAAGLAGTQRRRPVEAALEALPELIRSGFDGAAFRALPLSPRRVGHRVYVVEPDGIVHLHAEESAYSGLGDALEAQRVVLARGVPGVPTVHAVAETPGALWLLEDRLPGHRADRRRRAGWWPRATAWLAGLADGHGSALRETVWWQRYRPELLTAAAEASEAVAAALERLGDLLAIPVHGEPCPRHLLLTPGSIGVVGWELAVPAGPPGLDLVLLALGVGDRRSTLHALMRGQESPAGPLLEALRRVGVPPPLVPAAVVCALAHATAVERRRSELLGLPRAPARAAALLREAVVANR